MKFTHLKFGDKFKLPENLFIYLKYDNRQHAKPDLQCVPDNYINLKTGETFLAQDKLEVEKIEI